MSVQHDTPTRSSRALLTDRTFGPYFFGNLTSNCGTWLQNIAAAVVVYRLTRSTLLVGAVSVLQFSASLVLSPWAGALSDRVDRRRLLLGGQLLAATAATVLAVWTTAVGVEGLPGPWPILAAAGLIGIGFAISVPTMQALVPALVEERDLDQAVALNSVTFNLARAVGPALGAVVVVSLGAAAAFAINAATYAVLIVVLLWIRPRPVARRADAGDGSVREGLRYVRAQPALMILLVGVTALGFGSDPVNTLTPAMADLLGGGESLVGWLVSAFGGGAALTALVIGAVRRRVALGPLSVAGLGILAAGLVAFAVSPVPWAAVASLAVAGVGFLLAITALTTELQQRVEEHVRGRVMALWGVAFLGSRPFAAFLDGAVADLAGPRAAAVTAGVITATVALWVRTARRRHGLTQSPGRLGSPHAG
ncbi:MAG TPA: MFS transporter [Egibacteraceae bacterium]|nr:MFS transporter [Egibacteraceae bacterium]